MTLTFDTNLDKRYLATKENKQVQPISNQTLLKVNKTLCDHFFVVVEDTAGNVKDDDADNDDGEDDENRSDDDDIDDFDEDNDSKSEVDHKKKVNDDPQKEKRWTLLKKDRLRRRFALNSFTFLQIQVWPGKKLNENGLMYLIS